MKKSPMKPKANKVRVPIKVVYISSSMKVTTTKSEFRAVVQELTGRHSNVAGNMAKCLNPLFDDQPITVEMPKVDHVGTDNVIDSPLEMFDQEYFSLPVLENLPAGLMPPLHLYEYQDSLWSLGC